VGNPDGAVVDDSLGTVVAVMRYAVVVVAVVGVVDDDPRSTVVAVMVGAVVVLGVVGGGAATASFTSGA